MDLFKYIVPFLTVTAFLQAITIVNLIYCRNTTPVAKKNEPKKCNLSCIDGDWKLGRLNCIQVEDTKYGCSIEI
jgi:hypothetical protein